MKAVRSRKVLITSKRSPRVVLSLLLYSPAILIPAYMTFSGLWRQTDSPLLFLLLGLGFASMGIIISLEKATSALRVTDSSVELSSAFGTKIHYFHNIVGIEFFEGQKGMKMLTLVVKNEDDGKERAIATYVDPYENHLAILKQLVDLVYNQNPDVKLDAGVLKRLGKPPYNTAILRQKQPM